MRRAGEELGGYVLLRSLGSGGMGTVYEALDADRRHVALKLLHPHIGADPTARDRLRREVASLHRVRHAGVARVLDAEADSDEAFVVTELVEGRTLDAAVRADGPFAGADLAGLARGLADALEEIHRSGVVHRDVKPQNVMLTTDGPVLIDFGIAQILEESERVTQTGMVAGTPGYLDPEVVAGRPPTAGADWWSWAAVVAFAGTGRPPFGRAAMDVTLRRVARGEADLAGLPTDVSRALRAALAPDPSGRLAPESVLAVLDGDASPLTALVPPPPPPPVRAAPPHPRSVPPAVLPAVTAAVPAPGPAAGPSATSGPVPAPRHPGPVPPPPPPQPVPPPTRVGAPWPVAVPAPAGGTGAAPAADRPSGYWLPAGGPSVGWSGAVPDLGAAGAQSRRALLVGLWLAGAALAAVWPGAVAVVTVAVLVATGAVGSGVRATRSRRARAGARGSDVLLAWVGTPYHLLRGALAVAACLLPAALAGGAAWLVGWLVVTGGAGSPAAVGGAAEAVLAAVAFAAAVAAAWLAPTGALPRLGARETWRTLPRPADVVVLVVGVVLAVLVVAAVGLLDLAPDYVPFAAAGG